MSSHPLSRLYSPRFIFSNKSVLPRNSYRIHCSYTLLDTHESTIPRCQWSFVQGNEIALDSFDQGVYPLHCAKSKRPRPRRCNVGLEVIKRRSQVLSENMINHEDFRTKLLERGGWLLHLDRTGRDWDACHPVWTRQQGMFTF